MPKLRAFQIDTLELGQDPNIASGVGGNLTLEGLNDVNAPSPVDADVLTWDSGSSMWINAVSAGGSLTLGGLDDVILTSSTTGQLLSYNGTDWVNTANISGVLTIETTLTIQPPDATTDTATIIRRSDASAAATIVWQFGDDSLRIQKSDAAGTLATELMFDDSGNVALTTSAIPTDATHLIRKDYMESATVSKQDMLRTGSRLDIFNVRTS